MKDWSEITNDSIVYFTKELDVTDENENVVAKVPPLQKLRVFQAYKDEYGMYVFSGKHQGEEFYFHPGEDNIEDFLSEAEYKSLKNTEAAVWPKLVKFIPEIEALKEKSIEMETLLILLKAHGPKS